MGGSPHMNEANTHAERDSSIVQMHEAPTGAQCVAGIFRKGETH